MHLPLGHAKITLLAAALLLTVMLTAAGPAAAAPPSVTPAAGAISEAADYASENWADRWDYSNAEDLSLTPVVHSFNASNLSMSSPAGSLSLDIGANGYIEPVWSSWVLAHNRDAGLKPVDAARYQRLSIRMWSSGAGTGQIWWATCPQNGPQCWGARSLSVEPGWNTYDLSMAPGYPASYPLPWAGQIRNLRIIPTVNSSLHLEIDWIRLYQPDAGVNLSVQSGQGSSELWWADMSDPANTNPPQNATRSAGRLTQQSNGGNYTFPASAFPPGTYRFFTRQNGQVSQYSSALVIEARPEPLVIQPDVAGGEDFATVVRGDPWDFSQSTDAWSISNALSGWGGWYLQGSYAGPNPNDPQVTLPLAGPIDASLYHRLTFRIGYDGTFGLENAPGGGMVTRYLWGFNNGTGGMEWHDSQDMIIFPGWQTVSVDLKTNPPSLAEDEQAPNPRGWGGPASAWVDSLIYRPHEDPGGRNWYLDDIRLARNDRGTPNFNIQFRDNAWKPGTAAEIYADSDGAGYDGTRIASGISVADGVNTYSWNGSGVNAGSWWIYVVLTDGDGTTGRSYSTGPVDITPPADAVPPAVAYAGPSGSVAAGNPAVTATVSDPAPSSGINAASAKMVLDDGPEQPCTLSGGTISCLTSGLENGGHSATISITDNLGNLGVDTGSFTVTGQSYSIHENHFTWYDSIGASNWVVMANPGDSQTNVTFGLDIAGNLKQIGALTGFAPGEVAPAHSVSAIYPGVMDGPVTVSYKVTGGSPDKAFATQRSLWAGKSLEEVPAAGPDDLSNHFYWSWYDDMSPGYSNWVMIANPGDATAYYSIRVAGTEMHTGSLPAGETTTWRDELMGGPVEVEAWTDGVGGNIPAQVLASQRVLSGYGGAFNEVRGTPAASLASRYLWTWYDSIGAAGSDWVMIANPGNGPAGMYYRLEIAGNEEVACGGPIAPNGYDYWSRGNLRGGPVDLTTYSDAACTQPADSVASQRVIWGPSFEEVPGSAWQLLSDTYHWPWYDSQSPGAQNWVMITNPGQAPVTYSITIGAETTPVESIAPGASIFKSFSPRMGGPVRVNASAPVIASQRVLWNGYFNEVPGIVLN